METYINYYRKGDIYLGVQNIYKISNGYQTLYQRFYENKTREFIDQNKENHCHGPIIRFKYGI